MKHNNLRTMILMAIFVALAIVATRLLRVQTAEFRLSFGFIPIMIAAMYLGWWKAGAVAAVADIIGFFLFPVGVFFPGYTVSAFVDGAIQGAFLEGPKARKPLNVILGCFLAILISNTFLNTLWVMLTTYGGDISRIPLLLSIRVPNQAIMLVVRIILAKLFYEALVRRVRLRGVERFDPALL